MAIIGETNITMSSVRDTLNDAGGSVGNDLTSFFKSSAKLNMWSKFKPLVFGLNFINLWDKRTADLYYYQGEDGNCGITIPEFSSPQGIRTALVDGSYKWSYRLPTGGSSEPLRLGDFRRYNPDAHCPVGQIGNLILKSDYTIDINIDAGVSDASHNLTLNDFSMRGVKLKNMYLGVYLYKSSSSYVFTSSPTPIGDAETLSFTIKANSGVTGKFKVYIFLATSSQHGVENSGYFYGLPIEGNGNGAEIEIQPEGSSLKYSVGGSYTPNTKNMSYSVTIDNNSNKSETFSKLYLRVRVDMGNGDGWQTEGFDREIATNLTVSAGKTVILDGNLLHSATFNENYMYGVYITRGTGTPILGEGFLENDSEP